MRALAPLPSGTIIATFASAAMIAQQVAGKAARDALFLSTFPVTSLPWMMAASALLSLVAVLWISRLIARYSPSRVLPVMFGLNALALLAEWGLNTYSAALATLGLYLHMAVLGATVISAFWSVINERFDPHTGKRAVRWIAAGGTLGGVLGGLSAWRAAALIPVAALLPVLAALNILCAWGTLRLRRAAARSEVPGGSPADTLSSLRTLRDNAYLRDLALVVALGAITTGLLEYVFSAEAARAMSDGPELLSFFALFWLTVGVLSFALQSLVGRIVLEKLGLAMTIALLPGGVVLGGAIGLAVPGLWSAAIVRGGEAVQRNSLFRSAYEMLYTPLAEDTKRSTKAIIDVGFDRLGTVAASGIAVLAIALGADRASGVLMILGVVCALVTAALSRPLHLRYVAVLAESLKAEAEKHVPSLAPVPPETVAVRDEVIAHLDALPATSELAATSGQPRLTEAPDAPEDAWAVVLGERSANVHLLRQAIDHLCSGDAQRVRKVLCADVPLPMPAVPLALMLLADEEVHVDALRALRAVAGRITGQLVDALCDPSVSFDIRRRVPRALSECATQRAIDGLILGTDDERFEVRYQCGRSLLRLTGLNKDLVVPLETVLSIVRKEVGRSTEVWESQPASDDGDDEAPALIDRLLRDRIDRSLEHIFTILALRLDRDSLRIAFKALHQEDERLRGTALEYLETVLPTEIRDAVWPFLGEERPMRAARPASEILQDLLQAGQAPPEASTVHAP